MEALIAKLRSHIHTFWWIQWRRGLDEEGQDHQMLRRFEHALVASVSVDCRASPKELKLRQSRCN